MVPTTLHELVTLSNELARLRNEPLATVRPAPANRELHPDLASVLVCGALGLSLQGVDLSRLTEFTQNARSRGMRRRAIVFGWHPGGHTWFATPENHSDDAVVLMINRRDQLSTRDLSVAEFVDLCIEDTRAAIVVANAPPVEPPPPPTELPAQTQLKGRRSPIKVRLPESDGASVVADGKTTELTGPELAYICWCMEGLRLFTEQTAPDLSRWEARCLRMCRIDSVPASGDKDRARYDENWARITRKDRAAPGPISHQIASWKLSAPGAWILAPAELVVLRRADMAIAPRHKPSADQVAIWARWMAIVRADEVELYVH